MDNLSAREQIAASGACLRTFPAELIAEAIMEKRQAVPCPSPNQCQGSVRLDGSQGIACVGITLALIKLRDARANP